MKIESRGVECLNCKNLDLKSCPAEAKEGYGRCTIDPPGVFVRVQMARNCASYDPAAPEIVEARIVWAAKIKTPAWQR